MKLFIRKFDKQYPETFHRVPSFITYRQRRLITHTAEYFDQHEVDAYKLFGLRLLLKKHGYVELTGWMPTENSASYHVFLRYSK